jgi:hypothetical protein
MSNLKELKITLVAPELNKIEGKVAQKPPMFKTPLDNSVV